LRAAGRAVHNDGVPGNPDFIENLKQLPDFLVVVKHHIPEWSNRRNRSNWRGHVHLDLP